MMSSCKSCTPNVATLQSGEFLMLKVGNVLDSDSLTEKSNAILSLQFFV